MTEPKDIVEQLRVNALDLARAGRQRSVGHAHWATLNVPHKQPNYMAREALRRKRPIENTHDAARIAPLGIALRNILKETDHG